MRADPLQVEYLSYMRPIQIIVQQSADEDGANFQAPMPLAHLNTSLNILAKRSSLTQITHFMYEELLNSPFCPGLVPFDKPQVITASCYDLARCSNSQYANPGSAFGETANGEKYVEAVNQATGKSSDSNSDSPGHKRLAQKCSI
jgi:hypothetical protein